MTLRTSAVAVCCWSDSDSSSVRACTSSNSRTFSIAITASLAKVCNSAICLSENARTSVRRTASTPIAWSLNSGVSLLPVRARTKPVASLCRSPGSVRSPRPPSTAIEDPDNFKKSRAVGAWLGLTPRRYQSGEVDYDGHISRRGDRHLRGLLYEAATVILTRSSAESGLRTWGLKLRERIGFKRAAVAVARKLAVTMHAMLKAGTVFDRSVGAAA